MTKMSSSSVSQGLQSCLEPKLMEPLVLRLKLTPPKSKFSPSMAPPTSITTTNNKDSCNDDGGDMKSDKTEADTGGWSFLQCLKNTKKETAGVDDNEKVYVHPHAKRNVLSEKSLEMCTESLGSETGANLISSPEITEITNYYTSTKNDKPAQEASQTVDSGDNSICTQIYSSFACKKTVSATPTCHQQRGDNFVMTKRMTNRSLSFPPPLTSISGTSSGVQVRPHREGGRLLLQAVMTVSSSSKTSFHAERSDGRLRLCLVKNPPSSDEDDQDYEDEFDEEDDEVYCDDGDDMEGETEKVRGEIGIEKLPRPSRCNEGGRGAGNKLLWEPFWVAT